MTSPYDPLILTRGDTSLYRSDVLSASPGAWLTDAAIAYAFEVLAPHPKPALALVAPTIVRLVNDLQGDDPATVRAILAGSPLLTARLLLLPVNDAAAHVFGGSHWSTLLVDVLSQKFVHFDSYGGSNRMPALRLARTVAGVLGIRVPSQLPEGECVQQTNGHDCGVCVVAIAAALAQHGGEGLDVATWRPLAPDTDLGATREWLQDQLADDLANRE
ncbi:hypothetical protein H9P43_007326 [Blastocladiella emersonii ATCC 22665]|nr:hypothetical protein H9P43_007326 [Blastocladiella emersonii ATCC 22665]